MTSSMIPLELATLLDDLRRLLRRRLDRRRVLGLVERLRLALLRRLDEDRRRVVRRREAGGEEDRRREDGGEEDRRREDGGEDLLR